MHDTSLFFGTKLYKDILISSSSVAYVGGRQETPKSLKKTDRQILFYLNWDFCENTSDILITFYGHDCGMDKMGKDLLL